MNNVELMACAASNAMAALEAHPFAAAKAVASPAQLLSEFGGIAFTAARRVNALKKNPPYQWVFAAEDVLVCAAKQVLPGETPQRLRRLAAQHVQGTREALFAWRNGQ